MKSIFIIILITSLIWTVQKQPEIIWLQTERQTKKQIIKYIECTVYNFDGNYNMFEKKTI